MERPTFRLRGSYGGPPTPLAEAVRSAGLTRRKTGQRTPLRSFWHTDVYEKRNGRWQVVWSQATLIQ
jgi:hypothetical protein